MKKTIVIDTNVLLDNPHVLTSIPKSEIVIPYKVIEELDKHKYTPGLKGLNARDCGRLLASLIEKAGQESLKTGIKLGNGSLLFVKSHKDYVVPELEENNADDCILKVALGLIQEGKDVVLTSNDILLKIRANTFNLKCQGYDSSQDLQSIKDLHTGYKSIPVDESVMEVFYQNRGKEKYFPIAPKKLTKEKLLLNDFVILTNSVIDNKKKPYALLRYVGEKHGFEYVIEQKLGNKIKAANIEQTMAIDLLMDKNVPLVTLTGFAGTGKTMLALAAALDQVLETKTYLSIIVLRPMIALGKEIGFLPGSKEEKLEPWVAPIKDNLRFIMADPSDNGRKSKMNENNVNYLFDNGIIEVEAMTYIRGRSINNAFIIVDEAQNITAHELKAILTRVGKDTKIVLTGDIEQTDRNDVDSISNGLSVAVEKFKPYGLVGHVSLVEGMRSELSELAAKIL